jgi:hypothetical protein
MTLRLQRRFYIVVLSPGVHTPGFITMLLCSNRYHGVKRQGDAVLITYHEMRVAPCAAKRPGNILGCKPDVGSGAQCDENLIVYEGNPAAKRPGDIAWGVNLMLVLRHNVMRT